MIGIEQIGMLNQSIYNSLTKEQKDRIEDFSSGDNSPLVRLTEQGIRDYSQLIDLGLESGWLIFNAGELPEVTIGPRKNLYLQLDTYYPFVSKYKYTGHSQLGRVNKSGKSNDYNLLTNNCANATKRCLEYIFNKQDKNFLFTTPGDVRDFAIDKLHGIRIPKGYTYNQETDQLKKDNEKGKESILIPVTPKQMKLYRQYILKNKNDRY